jgi:hypothetical protein
MIAIYTRGNLDERVSLKLFDKSHVKRTQNPRKCLWKLVKVDECQNEVSMCACRLASYGKSFARGFSAGSNTKPGDSADN